MYMYTHIQIRIQSCIFWQASLPWFQFLKLLNLQLSHQGIEALESYEMGSERRQTSYQSLQHYIQPLPFLSGAKLFCFLSLWKTKKQTSAPVRDGFQQRSFAWARHIVRNLDSNWSRKGSLCFLPGCHIEDLLTVI